jgi:hypothetical protein
MPAQCDPCAESKVACHWMLGTGPDFPCQKCYERKLECDRSSSRYLRVFSCQSCVLHASLLPPVLHPRHASRAATNTVAGPSHRSHLPPVGKRWSTLRAAGYDAPFPASEREASYTGLDPEHAALFWCSELEHSEAMIDMSYRQHDFHCQQLDKALARCQVLPPSDSPRLKCIKFTGPASRCGCMFSERCDNGKHCTNPVPKESSQDEGQGCADPAKDDSEEEGSSGEAEDWFGL